MWKAALVGAFALAAVGASSVCAQELQNQSGGEIRQATQSLISLTRNDIARFKSALKLRPEQEQHWPAVNTALAELASEQAVAPDTGIVARVRNKVASIALTASAIRKIGFAAMPLINSLDENQKRDAQRLVSSMGMGHLAAAF